MQYAYDEISHVPIHIRQVSKANVTNFMLKCIKCKGDIILKDGGTNVKHFSHKANSSHGYTGPESEQHELAKFLLADFLNKRTDNEVLTVEVCGCHMTEVSFTDCKAEIEYKVANGIADVAIINSKAEVVCIFEIKHTHATSFRKEKWFEFSAAEIVAKLLPNPSMVTLTDVRVCVCPKIPVSELAVTLGYCTIMSEWDRLDRRITLLCLKVKSYDLTYKWGWVEPTHNDIWRKTWMDFESRQKCLRCEKHNKPNRGKPYCLSCYKEIQHGDNCDIVTKFLPTEPLNAMKNYFKWLSAIPEVKDCHGSCSVCDESCQYVWFHGYREICIDCIVLHHRKIYPSGEYLTSTSDDVAKILTAYNSKEKSY